MPTAFTSGFYGSDEVTKPAGNASMERGMGTRLEVELLIYRDEFD